MLNGLKIGVLIPTRGNRPEFFQLCQLFLSKQTIQPDFIEVVDDVPKSHQVDITYRYKLGCERLFKQGADVVIFWEDDDWYSFKYIEILINLYCINNKPAIFGIDSTIYYHIITKKWFKITHPGRASMMSTMVNNKILDINWPANDYPYLDTVVWKELKGKAVILNQPINIGIKHGIGLVGGGAHQKDSPHYQYNDIDMAYLKSIVGEDYLFYKNISENV